MKEDVKDKVKELTSKLDEGVKDILTSDRYKAYLKQMSKFHNYSYNNALLIFLQKEDATLVAGFKAWQTKFNRTVNKGEKGIKILAPCPFKVQKEIEFINAKGEKETKIEEVVYPRFKTVTVFDVSQTSGEPLKEFAEELKGKYGNYKNLLEAIKKCSSFDIVFKDSVGISEAKGLCSYKDKTILIKNNMSEIQTIKTLIHEVAHELLHFNKEKETSRNQQEIEAESIAYVVSNYFGIDTSSYSFDYITSWQDNDKAEVKQSLQVIQETSNMLINKIESNLMLDKEVSIEDKIKIAQEKSNNENCKNNKEKKKNKDVSL